MRRCPHRCLRHDTNRLARRDCIHASGAMKSTGNRASCSRLCRVAGLRGQALGKALQRWLPCAQVLPSHAKETGSSWGRRDGMGSDCDAVCGPPKGPCGMRRSAVPPLMMPLMTPQRCDVGVGRQRERRARDARRREQWLRARGGRWQIMADREGIGDRSRGAEGQRRRASRVPRRGIHSCTEL